MIVIDERESVGKWLIGLNFDSILLLSMSLALLIAVIECIIEGISLRDLVEEVGVVLAFEDLLEIFCWLVQAMFLD